VSAHITDRATKSGDKREARARQSASSWTQQGAASSTLLQDVGNRAVGRLAGGGLPPGFPTLHARALQAGGIPVPRDVRAEIARRIAAPLGNVRLHTGLQAGQAAEAVEADAYTLGGDIVFGTGRFAPGTSAGRRLLSHELAHVLQQEGMAAKGSPPRKVSRPGDAEELGADALAGSIPRVAAPPGTVLRQQSTAASAASSQGAPQLVSKEIPAYTPSGTFDPAAVDVGALTNEALVTEIFRVYDWLAQHGTGDGDHAAYAILGDRLANERGRRIGIGYVWLQVAGRQLPSTFVGVAAGGEGRRAVTAPDRTTALGPPNDLKDGQIMTADQFQSMLEARGIPTVDAATYARLTMQRQALAQSSGGLGMPELAGTVGGSMPRFRTPLPDIDLGPTALSYPATGTPPPRGQRGIFGEQGMAFSGYSMQQGWGFLEGPSGTAGHAWNAPGFDGVAFRTDGAFELHILDNKAYKASGNVGTSSASALTRNLTQNLDALILRAADPSLNDVPRIVEVRAALQNARAALAAGRSLPPEVKLVITNYGGNKTGVTADLASRGVEFRDLQSTPARGPMAPYTDFLRPLGEPAVRGAAYGGLISFVVEGGIMTFDTREHPYWERELAGATGRGALGGSVASTTERLLAGRLGFGAMGTPRLGGAGAGLGAVVLEGLDIALEERQHSGEEVVLREGRAFVIGGASGYAATVVGGATGTILSSALAGTALGTAVPGLGNAIGFIVGLGVGIAIAYGLSQAIPQVPANIGAGTSSSQTAAQAIQRYEDRPLGPGCFAAETLVSMSDGRRRPIASLAPGDEVLGYDDRLDEFRTVTVLANTSHTGHVCLDVSLSDSRHVRLTAEHPIRSRSLWMPASGLEGGTVVMCLDEEGSLAGAEVSSIVREECPTTVFELSVNDCHTYFAGGLLAHNKNI
jgi:hypothetical protein